MTATVKLKFDEHDARKANDEWGCNCGPSALAAAFDLSLDEVRSHMGPFEVRGYTNITNMRNAIASVGGVVARQYDGWPPVGRGLVRIQFGGPWIINGKPAMWAAKATHWIATYRTEGSWLYVFDINSGIVPVSTWEEETVPRLTNNIKRADGTWNITHSWGVLLPQTSRSTALAPGAPQS